MQAREDRWLTERLESRATEIGGSNVAKMPSILLPASVEDSIELRVWRVSMPPTRRGLYWIVECDLQSCRCR